MWAGGQAAWGVNGQGRVLSAEGQCWGSALGVLRARPREEASAVTLVPVAVPLSHTCLPPAPLAAWPVRLCVHNFMQFYSPKKKCLYPRTPYTIRKSSEGPAAVGAPGKRRPRPGQGDPRPSLRFRTRLLEPGLGQPALDSHLKTVTNVCQRACARTSTTNWKPLVLSQPQTLCCLVPAHRQARQGRPAVAAQLSLKQKQTGPGRRIVSPRPSSFVEVTERCLGGSHGARTLGPP